MSDVAFPANPAARRARPRVAHRRPARRRASVLMVSIILVFVAAFAVMSWMVFVTDTMRSTERERDRMQAFYAAEAGIELVVDFFNNFENFLGDPPNSYRDER